jgi:hypothetical protein
LKKRVIRQIATEEEKKLFWELNRRFVNMILKAEDDDLFDIQRFEMTILVKVDRYNSLYVPRYKHPPPLNTCPCSPDEGS